MTWEKITPQQGRKQFFQRIIQQLTQS
jgi:hypothetical protein